MHQKWPNKDPLQLVDAVLRMSHKGASKWAHVLCKRAISKGRVRLEGIENDTSTGWKRLSSLEAHALGTTSTMPPQWASVLQGPRRWSPLVNVGQCHGWAKTQAWALANDRGEREQKPQSAKADLVFTFEHSSLSPKKLDLQNRVDAGGPLHTPKRATPSVRWALVLRAMMEPLHLAPRQALRMFEQWGRALGVTDVEGIAAEFGHPGPCSLLVFLRVAHRHLSNGRGEAGLAATYQLVFRKRGRMVDAVHLGVVLKVPKFSDGEVQLTSLLGSKKKANKTQTKGKEEDDELSKDEHDSKWR